MPSPLDMYVARKQRERQTKLVFWLLLVPLLVCVVIGAAGIAWKIWTL